MGSRGLVGQRLGVIDDICDGRSEMEWRIRVRCEQLGQDALMFGALGRLRQEDRNFESNLV